MGRLLLVGRLALRDLRRRRAEAALLLLVLMAATTTLTLGLVLREAGNDPYQNTRDATSGPDVIASVAPADDGTPADLAGLEALTDAPEVTAHSGPYPMVSTELEASDGDAPVWAQGRDPAKASVDQPELTEGSWVRDGGVVVEAGLAAALGVGEGDQIAVGGREFQVAGVAVSAAATPYPGVCFAPCHFGAWEPVEDELPPPPDAGAEPESDSDRLDLDSSWFEDSGLVWLTEADARSLAPQADSLFYVLNLRLTDPSQAPAFVDAHATASGPALATWQDLLDHHTNLVQNVRLVLLNGSTLVSILAVASVAVLVGGRMADQTRRVGLLKAVGGTPSLVAAVLLAEYIIVALLAAAGGLAAGWLTAPLLAAPSASLIGSPGTPTLTLARVGLVAAVALAVAVIATFAPAIRAARTSTVSALADAARPPRRTAWLIKISARLPVPLLLGLRVAGRRPRRMLLTVASIAITVSGIVVALAGRANIASSGADKYELRAANQVLLVITLMLVALAAVNTIFITWTTALDARHPSALTRALGATPREVSTGLSAAQIVPALAGALLGIPGGIALYWALIPAGDPAPTPPSWWLLAVMAGTLLVVTALTAVPASLGGRRPVAEILQAEHA